MARFAGYFQGHHPELPIATFDLDPTSGNDHIRFRFTGKPYDRSHRLEAEREAALWECLYLDEARIKACLEHAIYPFVYPMFCFCTYTAEGLPGFEVGRMTGDRRSESRQKFTGIVAIFRDSHCFPTKRLYNPRSDQLWAGSS